LSIEQITSFIVEEAARTVRDRQELWMALHPEEAKKIDRFFWINNEINGQCTEIPPAPKSAQDFLSHKRKDFILNNWFTEEEFTSLKSIREFRDMDKYLEIQLPA
jgi:hypothetical protein